MTQGQGRGEDGRVGRRLERWVGGIGACLMLLTSTPAAAVDEFAPVVTSYAQCVQAYRVRRTDFATYCRSRFPLTLQEAATRSATRMAVLTGAPAAASPPGATPVPTPSATAPVPTSPPAAAATPATTSPPPSRKPPREPVDITPAVNTLIEAWASRPRNPTPPSPPPSRRPADPLAVIPGIQALCASYAGNPDRWRRCTTDAWNRAGLRGQPPLVLQVPPAPPPVVTASTVPAPPRPPRARPDSPPVAKPRPEPPVQVLPDPPVDAAPPPRPLPPEPASSQAKIADPPLPSPSPSPSPPVSRWVWVMADVLALVAAGAAGFGASHWRARVQAAKAARGGAASAPTKIVLVADPGVVVVTPDGPPRAGMAISMRLLPYDDGEGAVRLDYPILETAP